MNMMYFYLLCMTNHRLSALVLVLPVHTLRALYSEEISSAASLGVNLTLVSSWTLACNRANMLADDGRCKTLDAAADGYVRAEGMAALFLRRWQHQDHGNAARVLAVLSGTAVNQDGRSSSLTAPNGPSQQAVIRSALGNGGLEAHQITGLEVHGTGAWK